MYYNADLITFPFESPLLPTKVQPLTPVCTPVFMLDEAKGIRVLNNVKVGSACLAEIE